MTEAVTDNVGCCHNTIKQPASLKIYDGPIGSGGDCNWKCTAPQAHPGQQCWVTYKQSGWCTVWVPSFNDCYPLSPSPSDCGNDFSDANTYLFNAHLQSMTEAVTDNVGCCHNTIK